MDFMGFVGLDGTFVPGVQEVSNLYGMGNTRLALIAT